MLARLVVRFGSVALQSMFALLSLSLIFAETGGGKPGDPLLSNGPLVYTAHILDDDNGGNSTGNGNGIANPGETIELFVSLHNEGTVAATAVTAMVLEDSPYINGFIFNNSSAYPDILADGSAANIDDYCFFVDPAAPDGHVVTVTIIASSAEGGPWTSSFTFAIDGPGVAGPLLYNGHSIDDDNGGNSNGNGDGIVNPGETIELFARLTNQGPDPATAVLGVLSEDSPFVTDFLFNDTSAYPIIPGGGSAPNSDDFCFLIDPATPDGHVITFTIVATSAEGGPWSSSFTVAVTGPGVAGPLVHNGFSIDDGPTGNSNGNNDGIVNPGETIEVFVNLNNQGPDPATSVSATIVEDSPFINGFLFNNSSTYPTIPGGGSAVNLNDFCFYLDPAAPNGHVITFTITATALQGGPWSSSFSATVTAFGVAGPLVYLSHQISDDNSGSSSGNGDGIINPGETIELITSLFNQGQAPATGITSRVSENSPFVNGFPGGNLLHYPGLPGGGSASSNDTLIFLVEAAAPDGHIITITSADSSLQGGPWFNSFDMTVHNPPVGPTASICIQSILTSVPGNTGALLPLVIDIGNPNAITAPDDFVAVSFDLTWDNPAMLGFATATAGAFLGANPQVQISDFNNHITAQLSRSDGIGQTGSGIVLDLILQVEETTPDSQVIHLNLTNIAGLQSNGSVLNLENCGPISILLLPGATTQQAPVVMAISDTSLMENQTLTLGIVAADANNDPLVLSASGAPAFSQFVDNQDGTGILSFSPGFSDAGLFVGITITATDPGGLSASVGFSLEVFNVNRPPALEPIANQNVDEGMRIAIPLIAADPDGQSPVLTVDPPLAFMQVLDSSDGNTYLQIAPGPDDSGNYPLEVRATDPEGASDSETFTLTIANVLTVQGDPSLNGIPGAFQLLQNYPNPFNPTTTMVFGVPATAKVRLNVYNVVGQLVATLVDGTRDAGYHKVRFSGDGLPSGIYLYRLESGAFQTTQRLLLLK